jgi:hypothetical protein
MVIGTTDFMHLDPLRTLARPLYEYPVLTRGSTIYIPFNDRIFRLEVVKTAPQEAIFALQADLDLGIPPPESAFSRDWLIAGEGDERRDLGIARTVVRDLDLGESRNRRGGRGAKRSRNREDPRESV